MKISMWFPETENLSNDRFIISVSIEGLKAANMTAFTVSSDDKAVALMTFLSSV